MSRPDLLCLAVLSSDIPACFQGFMSVFGEYVIHLREKLVLVNVQLRLLLLGDHNGDAGHVHHLEVDRNLHVLYVLNMLNVN